MNKFKTIMMVLALTMLSVQVAGANESAINFASVAAACTPTTTECSAASECGTEPDDCGGTIDCGTCDIGLECVANMCEVGVICACDNDWKNHGQYVKCVFEVTNIAQKAGIISGKEKGEIVSEASKSDCGRY